MKNPFLNSHPMKNPFRFSQLIYQNDCAMKIILTRVILFFLFAFAAGVAEAQPPAGIPYQFVAKDNIGNPARNRTVYVKCSIIQTVAVGGTTALEETHQVQSNNDGVFEIIIGQGTKTPTSLNKSLSTIPWANGPFFFNLKIAVAPSIPASWWVAADNYVDMGTMQLWSAPYALYAGNASVTNVNTSIKAGPVNTFLVTDSTGQVSWAPPQAANVNVTQISNIVLTLSTTMGQTVLIQPNTTSVVKVYVPGVKKGDPVMVTPQGDYQNWSVYSSWVSNADTVAVRLANYTNDVVSVLGGQYKIVVIR